MALALVLCIVLGVGLMAGMTDRNEKKKVIIVGAGISGLAAAHDLHERGHQVVVLEAKDTIGGRIQSTTVNGQKFELGASFIHGNQKNPVAALLEQEGVGLTKVNFDDIVVYKDGQRTEISDDLDPFFSFTDKQKDTLDKDQSLLTTWQNFNGSRSANANELFYRLRIDNQTEIGTDLANISTLQYDEEGEFKGGDYLLKGDYDTVIKKLAKNIDIRLGHIVTSIKDSGSGVEVKTKDGKVFSADDVIVTVPLGVLQKGSIAFEPSFPVQKQKAVQGLKMGNLHKTFLVFDKVFWDDATTIGIMRGNGTKWGEFINIAAINGKPMLLALHGGSDATSLEGVSDEAIGEQVYEALKSAYPNATRPTSVVTSKWYADPFTLGSYSYVPPGATLSMYDDLAKPYGHIHFAGEHTSSAHPSTTHGAYLSGKRAASEM